MFYVCYRVLVRFMLRVFFGRFTVTGLEHVPADGALILVGNHLNGPLDPMFVLAALDRAPLTLTAHAKLKRHAILRLLIARLRAVTFDDSHNTRSLLRCHRLLEQGGALVIFPEGKSHDEARMLPFQPGAAKLALHSKARVLPFGLSFSDKSRFRGDATLCFGPPISTEGCDARALTRAMEEAIEPLRHVTMAEPARPNLLRSIDSVILGIPAALFGLVVNAAPHALVQWISKKLSSDLDHIDSNRFFAAMVVYPLLYALEALAVALLFDPRAALLCLALAPFTGLYALTYADRVRALSRRSASKGLICPSSETSPILTHATCAPAAEKAHSSPRSSRTGSTSLEASS